MSPSAPVIVSITDTATGDKFVTWSVRPGQRVSLTVPLGQFTPATLADLATHIVPTMGTPREARAV